jgi:hypothetical protein
MKIQQQVNLSILFKLKLFPHSYNCWLTTICCTTVLSETYLYRPIKGSHDDKLTKVEFNGIMNQSKISAIVGANLPWTIPNIKVQYILVAKFPHGKRSLNILSTSFPNPNTRFLLCYSGLFTHNFLPFWNCVHEVNMTHACT